MPGWPETWYAWRLMMPAMAQDFRIIAVDQRGIGLSDKPADGYDTGTLANDLVAPCTPVDDVPLPGLHLADARFSGRD